MHRRSPARWLAPVALVTCAFAVYAVATSGLEDGGDADGDKQRTQQSSGKESQGSPTSKGGKSGGATTTTSGSGAADAAKTYTIQAGDTLSAVAAKTGVSLETIQRLNPQLDSNALRTGQKVKLAP